MTKEEALKLALNWFEDVDWQEGSDAPQAPEIVIAIKEALSLPVQTKRKWVGLTEAEKSEICRASAYIESALTLAEDLLKEQNT